MNKKIDVETLKNIIMTLNGDIHPTPTDHVNYGRIGDLDDYISLVSSLTEELYRIASYRKDDRRIVEEMGRMAFDYLENQYIILPIYFEGLEEQE